MAVKATASITVSHERDISSVWRFYRIASSATTPTAPTEAQGKAFIESGTAVPNWSTVEPAYDGTATNSLYICDLTAFSNGDVTWSPVSKSSSYEAAKQAYNRAESAAKTATGYITDISNGICVHEDDPDWTETTGDAVRITDNMVDVVQAGKLVASFGSSGAVIGAEGEARLQLTSDGIQGVDSEKNVYFKAQYDTNASTTGTKELPSESIQYNNVKVTSSAPFIYTKQYQLESSIQSGCAITLSNMFINFGGLTAQLETFVSQYNCRAEYFGSTWLVGANIDTKTFTQGSSSSWYAYITTSQGSVSIEHRVTYTYNASANTLSVEYKITATGNRSNGGIIIRTPVITYTATVLPVSMKLGNAFNVGWNGIPSCRDESDNFDTIFKLIYPVGSIYMSVNSTDPGTLFGGSWTRIQNRFLFSAGSFHSAGDEGGSRYIQAHTHSFTGASHNHGAGNNQAFLRYNQGTVDLGVQERSVASGASGNYKAPVVNSANVDWSYIANTGSETAGGTVGAVNGATTGLSGTTAEGNMPPFLTVYMWKRTA